MKLTLTLFIALVVLPLHNAQAWVGGPFSNNSYFGENGDDGVYEAVAVPRGKSRNGVGIYRWGVTNNFPGLDPQFTTSVVLTGPGGGTSGFRVPVSGNVDFGGVSQFTHTWFLNGVYYRGFCQGSVNSGLGFVSCIGAAQSLAGLSGIFQSISSSFRGSFTSRSQGVAISRFEGSGSASTTDGSGTFENFKFSVFGSKVAQGVQYFGLQPSS